ncbi:MAG: hypothetical protein IT453_17875 [Planctomycetes bacterium]|nr:hypothetical protein [Planctomycetota bacterium]
MLQPLFALASLSVGAPAVHESFTSLDRELQAALAAPSSGLNVRALLRTRGAFSGDVDASAAAGEQDLGGFSLDVARIEFAAKQGAYGLHVSLEAGAVASDDTASGPGVVLLDGYGSFDLCEGAAVRIGQFCSRFLWSSCIDERDLVFLDRSFVGESMDGRDTGVEFFGDADRLNWWVGAQNGFDGLADEVALSARASWRVLGDTLCCQEGALGIPHDAWLVGVGWFDDQSMDDGTIVGVDTYFARGGWSASAELADYGDDMAPMVGASTTTGVLAPGMGGMGGAETPWSVTVGYLFEGTPWQVAARWQDLDDMDDTSIATFGVNYHVGTGPTRWTFQVDHASSDATALEVDTLALGLTVGV